MSYQRLAYDDASTSDEMTSDCVAVGSTLPLVEQRQAGPRTHQVDDGDYDTVVVSDDLAALAAELELHLG